MGGMEISGGTGAKEGGLLTGVEVGGRRKPGGSGKVGSGKNVRSMKEQKGHQELVGMARKQCRQLDRVAQLAFERRENRE